MSNIRIPLRQRLRQQLRQQQQQQQQQKSSCLDPMTNLSDVFSKLSLSDSTSHSSSSLTTVLECKIHQSSENSHIPLCESLYSYFSKHRHVFRSLGLELVESMLKGLGISILPRDVKFLEDEISKAPTSPYSTPPPPSPIFQMNQACVIPVSIAFVGFFRRHRDYLKKSVVDVVDYSLRGLDLSFSDDFRAFLLEQ